MIKLKNKRYISHRSLLISKVIPFSYLSIGIICFISINEHFSHFNIKTSFEANVEAEDGEYHDYADKLSYVTYEGIPTWPLFNINNQELADHMRVLKEQGQDPNRRYWFIEVGENKLLSIL